jgi:hypothetical protein
MTAIWMSSPDSNWCQQSGFFREINLLGRDLWNKKGMPVSPKLWLAASFTNIDGNWMLHCSGLKLYHFPAVLVISDSNHAIPCHVI